MKVSICLEVPLEAEIKAAKGDRSYRELALQGKTGVAANLQRLGKGNGTTLETLRKLGAVLGIDVDAAVKKALKEKGL